MNEFLLDLRFKGERDYLHGTDMFNATLNCLQTRALKSGVKDVDFSIHRLGRSQVKLSMEAPPAGIEPVAVCAFTAEERQRAYLIETGHAITSRYPYPEDEIVSSMEVDVAARCGRLHGETAYTDIEVWVAMTKALHYKVFPNLNGKWMFVRGRFPQYSRHTRTKEQSLVISSSFNDKLTRSEISLDGVKAGDIYFSIV